MLESRESLRLAQAVELPVRVENERRPREPPRRPRAGRVEADDEEGGAGETEGKCGVRRIVADRIVPAVTGRVAVVKPLQSGP